MTNKQGCNRVCHICRRREGCTYLDSLRTDMEAYFYMVEQHTVEKWSKLD